MMPIYQYECECGTQQTFLVLKVTDNKPKCPACGNEMEKIISETGFQFGRDDKPGASFVDRHCKSNTGYARSMPELCHYMRTHHGDKLKSGKRNLKKDYKSDKIISVPK